MWISLRNQWKTFCLWSIYCQLTKKKRNFNHKFAEETCCEVTEDVVCNPNLRSRSMMDWESNLNETQGRNNVLFDEVTTDHLLFYLEVFDGRKEEENFGFVVKTYFLLSFFIFISIEKVSRNRKESARNSNSFSTTVCYFTVDCLFVCLFNSLLLFFIKFFAIFFVYDRKLYLLIVILIVWNVHSAKSTVVCLSDHTVSVRLFLN